MRRTLIIGATSAIAAQVARLCAARSEALYLLGRDEEKLAALTRALGAVVRGSAAADFTETAGNAARIDEAVRALGGLDSVIIAHGDLGDQLESERSYEHAEHLFSVNLLSVVSFLIPVANLLEAAGPRSGHERASILVLSSVAGDRGRPRNYTYGAAKAALNVYLMGLRSRLYGSGARVVAIRLGPVDTPMTDTHDKNVLFARAEDVARAIVAARDEGPEDVYVPWFWRPIMATVRALPERAFQRFRFLSGR